MNVSPGDVRECTADADLFGRYTFFVVDYQSRRRRDRDRRRLGYGRRNDDDDDSRRKSKSRGKSESNRDCTGRFSRRCLGRISGCRDLSVRSVTDVPGSYCNLANAQNAEPVYINHDVKGFDDYHTSPLSSWIFNIIIGVFLILFVLNIIFIWDTIR